MIFRSSQINSLGATFLVAPSGDGTDSADIQQAIDMANDLWKQDYKQRKVHLIEDNFNIDTCLYLKSGVKLCGSGINQSTLLPTFSGEGSSDSPLNAIIQAVGTIDISKLNTTLITEALFEGQNVLNVSNVGLLEVNDYILITGNNNTLGGPAILDSDGVDVLLSQCLKVKSISGNQITTYERSVQHHAIGSIVRAVSPIIDSEVSNITLDASAQTSVAVGILGRSCVEFNIENISGKGFSRSLIDLDQGTTEWHVKNILSKGQNNGLLRIDASHRGEWHKLYNSPKGLRYHVLGVPRGLLTYINRPCSNIGNTAHLCNGTQGVWFRGGVHNKLSNIIIENMDIRTTDAGGSLDAYTRLTNALEMDSGPKYGVGWEGVASPLPKVEIPIDNQINNLSFVDIVCDINHQYSSSMWEHDSYATVCNGISFVNRGKIIWNSNTRVMNGLLLRDVYGAVFQGGNSFGCYKHILVDDSNQVHVTLKDWKIESSAGNSGISTIGFDLDQPVNSGFKLINLILSNISVPFLFREHFADYNMTIENLEIDTSLLKIGYSQISKNESGIALLEGHVLEVLASSASGTRKVQKATESSENNRLAVWITGTDISLGAGKGFGLTSQLPANKSVPMLVNGTANINDILELSSTAGVAQKNNDTTRPCGKLLLPKTSSGTVLTLTWKE